MGWPLRIVALGQEELADPRIPDDVDARLAMVWTLTRQQWSFAGRTIPRYARSEMPGRVVRKGS